MSWEQRNADFCNAQTDAQMAYIEAEREVDRLQTENAKLREERDTYRDLVGMMDHPDLNAQLQAENAKLREQMERLVTLLRNDCDIDASWDGLRRFWSIGLTEDGCLMRDRACKAEAENDKLRELLRDTLTTISWCTIDCCPSDSKKRELNARACELGIEVG